MSAMEVEQTEPIEEEPFDFESFANDANRVREFIVRRHHVLIERSARAPWPISRRHLAAHAAGFADRVRREVVVEHEFAHACSGTSYRRSVRRPKFRESRRTRT